MMNRDENRNELGIVRIHNNVIASIASIAAMEVEGVKKIGKKLRNSLFEAVNSQMFASIKVEILKNEEVKIEIPLIVKYGYNIPEVASKVQENVRLALDKMSNLSIKDIDISVRGIERG